MNGSMSTKQNTKPSWLQQRVVRISRVHFVYVAAYAGLVIAYSGWNLIPPTALNQRWTITAAMLIATTLIWYAARNNVKNNGFYVTLIYLLIAMDIFVAAFSVYTQRGYASRAVALFAIPIITASSLLSRSALFATATLSLAAYSLGAIRYFTEHPSEGYKIELYGDIAFYGLIFFVLAALLWTIIRSPHTSK